MTVRAAPWAQLSLRRELIRKTLHLMAAAIPVAYFIGVRRDTLAALLTIASASAIVVEGARRINARASATFDRTVGYLLREGERKTLTGATWLILSCLFAVLFLSQRAAIAALWCATVGDSAAAIAGRAWSSSRKTGFATLPAKTLVGSLIFTGASLAGVSELAGYSLLPALIIVVVAAAAERLPWRLNDNVGVTAAAALAAQFLA